MRGRTPGKDAWEDKTFTHEDIKASFDAGFSMGFQAGVQAQKEAESND